MSHKKLIFSNITEAQVQNLLRVISNLYHYPEWSIFEYIQNSIDSALEYRKKYKIKEPKIIIIHIDEHKNRIIIQDNCVGMTNKKVDSLPDSVLCSDKKNYSWAVGQFGFGIQSFRSWFKKLDIISKNIIEKKGGSVVFEESNAFGMMSEKDLLDFGNIYTGNKSLILNRNNGTDIILSGLKKKGRNTSLSFICQKLKKMIPTHFEEPINDEIITIKLYHWKQLGAGKLRHFEEEINIINYDDYSGEEISGDVLLNDKNIAKYKFKILDNDATAKLKIDGLDYSPRVFHIGTKINYISKLPSFLEYCEKNNINNAIWFNSMIIGKLSITDKLEIDINRTDLPPSEERDKIFDELAKISIELEKKIAEIDKKRMQSHEQNLADIISDVLTDISKDLDIELKRRLRMKSNIGIESDLSEVGLGIDIGEKDVFVGGNKKDKSGIKITTDSDNINIESNTSANNGAAPDSNSGGDSNYKEIKQRGINIEIKPMGITGNPSELWGSLIVINKDHPYYQKRTELNKKSVITKRLVSYIAIVTTPWFLELYYKNKGYVPESDEKNKEIIKYITTVEDALWNKRDWLKKIAEVEGDG